ncbi:MAG: hypothetical protein IJI83_03175 [Oscillospiraceae bacterium]|nr:hypothetical protein [Oscillospiraceae bacterium]
MNETSKKLLFHGDPANYNTWANEMFRRGFNFSASDVMETLGVSASWINHVLLHEIPYVTYSAKFIQQKGITTREMTYIMYEDLAQWIRQTGEFKRQTELVDLYSYLSLADKTKAKKALDMYRSIIKASNIGYNPGIIPEAVLQYINKEYITNFEPKNLSCIRRSEVPWIDIEPFDFLEYRYILPKSGKTQELVYRDAFMNGDIKVLLGSRKSFLVSSNTNKDRMKMPWLIPYNRKIIVQAN